VPVTSVYPRLNFTEPSQCEAGILTMTGYTYTTHNRACGSSISTEAQDTRTLNESHESRERKLSQPKTEKAEQSFHSLLSGQLLRYRNRLWPTPNWNRHTWKWKLKQQAVHSPLGYLCWPFSLSVCQSLCFFCLLACLQPKWPF